MKPKWLLVALLFAPTVAAQSIPRIAFRGQELGQPLNPDNHKFNCLNASTWPNGTNEEQDATNKRAAAFGLAYQTFLQTGQTFCTYSVREEDGGKLVRHITVYQTSAPRAVVALIAKAYGPPTNGETLWQWYPPNPWSQPSGPGFVVFGKFRQVIEVAPLKVEDPQLGEYQLYSILDMAQTD